MDKRRPGTIFLVRPHVKHTKKNGHEDTKARRRPPLRFFVSSRPILFVTLTIFFVASI
jgi:hypothetical protein